MHIVALCSFRLLVAGVSCIDVKNVLVSVGTCKVEVVNFGRLDFVNE